MNRIVQIPLLFFLTSALLTAQNVSPSAAQQDSSAFKTPVIGILYSRAQAEGLAHGTNLLTNYVRAITENRGAVTDLSPLLTPAETAERLKAIDALIIPGGDDIEPSFYHVDRENSCETSDPEFDSYEGQAVNIAEERGIPILGICRGFQFLIAVNGGTLFQDIPTELHSLTNVVHRGEKDSAGKRSDAYHWVTILKGSWLDDILQLTGCIVNSAHHQGAQKLPPNFHATAWSPDGLVEGIEDNSGTILGVQFHPERLRLIPEFKAFNRIFDAFVRRAAETATVALRNPSDVRANTNVLSEAKTMIDKLVEAGLPDATNNYIDFHSHPELSGQEQRTREHLARTLAGIPGFVVSTNFGDYPKGSPLAGNRIYGVVAVLKNGIGPVLYIRIEEDALPVSENTGTSYASKTAGVMHACGHDVHMSAGIEAARILAGPLKRYWSGTLVIVCEPAEERGSGTEALLASGLYRNFPVPNMVIAAHDDPNLGAGKVACRPGIIFANAGSATIIVHGIGGHGAMPNLTKDPIRLDSELVPMLEMIPGRELPATHPALVTVGSIQGGQKGAVIPGIVTNLVSTRWIYDDDYGQMMRAIRRIAAGYEVVGGLATNYYPGFSSSEITNLRSLAHKFYTKSDGFSAFLITRLGTNAIWHEAQPLLTGYVTSNANPEILRIVLTALLNHVVFGPSLEEEARLQGIKLRPTTIMLANAVPSDRELARLNRMILEDAYSNELRRIPETFIEVEASKDPTPAIFNNDYLTRRLVGAFQTVFGPTNVVEAKLEMLADDFSRLGLNGQIMTCMFRIGATSSAKLEECRTMGIPPPQLHSAEFAPDYEDAIRTGVKAYITTVLELLGN